VVIPCYNAASTVTRAILSVLRQSYRDYWIYAVDDGSADDTMEVLRRNDDRCCVSSQANGGPAAARNRAIRMSDSEFVAFLDADDEWLPNKLARQIALLKGDPSLGMICSMCIIKRGELEETSGIGPEAVQSGHLFRHLARNCFVFTPTVVVRRRCLEEVGLFDETLPVSEDFNLWLRIAARWKIALVPEVLAVVHKRDASLSTTIPSEERLRAGVRALKNVELACGNLPPAEGRALRRAIAERIYFHASFLLFVGTRIAARSEFLSVLRYQPMHLRAAAKFGLSFLPTRIAPFAH